MNGLPAPLVPAEVDLTDFPFMPILIARLKQSRAWLTCKRRPELAFYMLNLWTASWHGRPAASLENDDEVLADLAMCSPKTWKALREDVLRGWVLCSDGRLYHPIVAERALDAWQKKIAQRARTDAARAAKEQRRLDKLNGSGGGKGGRVPVRTPEDRTTDAVTVSVTEAVTDSATGSKGQCKGEGDSSPSLRSGDSSVLTDGRLGAPPDLSGNSDPIVVPVRILGPALIDAPRSPPLRVVAGPEAGEADLPDPTEPERDLFRRGREVLGRHAGGQITKLLKAKDRNVPLARAAIETAATKEDPHEYVGAIIRGNTRGLAPGQLYDRGL